MALERKKVYSFNNNFFVGEKVIGKGCPCFIIAEAGVAHFGSLDKAFKLVNMAKEAKADAVKFQIFDTEKMISKAAPEWLERMKSRELPYESFEKIKQYCDKKNIIFLATAHDEESLEFLDWLNVPAFKVGSGEVLNWGMLEKVAEKGMPVILSTGMYSMEDIQEALKVIKGTGNNDLAVLHCVTEYPTPAEDVNLRAMNTIMEQFQVVGGYSDHTSGRIFPLASVALGANIIEKHISLDFNIPNAQDWKVSCGPEGLKYLVNEVRDLEKGLGKGQKEPSSKELESKEWAGKSLIAKDYIPEGSFIYNYMIEAKRPGYGIPPSKRPFLLECKAATKIEEGEMISWEKLQCK